METNILSQVLGSLFFTLSLIGVLLVTGTFLRAKFKIFQKLFLPASVIGGFIALLLGPIIWGSKAILPIPEDWIKIASLLPGYLIVPVVASVPLGLKFGKKKGSGVKSQVFPMFLVLSIVGGTQSVVALLVANIFRKSHNLYESFGTELSAGFAGGHGTAGVIGGMLRNAGADYWETAQGIATTTATVGLVGGILIGILLINIAYRKGYISGLKTKDALSEDMVTGVVKNVDDQKSAGKETTNSSSVDSLALHLALIMMVSGMAFFLVFILKKYNVLLLSSIPEWAYAIILMYAVWGIMVKLKLDWLVDTKTKTKIASSLTEFAVTAAILSLPIQAVFAYLLPLIIILVVGMIVTVASAYFISKWVFKEDRWFERSMTVMGTNTGVFLTGILLLKMVDPDLDSPVLKDYSISYSLFSVVGFVTIPLSFNLLLGGQYLFATLFFILMLAIYSVLLFMTMRKRKV